MTTQELFDVTESHLVQRIQKSNGLGNFAKRRAKFEVWFKVELIDILINAGKAALTEIQRIDVSFD
ncbi:MAG: hypothetical protein IPP69_04575 [Flavobacteriales bacterium]|nr:hypothetical protein [Flavobacteriales bacterium]